MSTEFPLLYDDELLTSGWARYYDHMGYSRLSYILKDLFGSDHVTQMSDLPMHIGVFAQRLPHGYPLTAEDLLQQHTFFPYHAPFLTSHQFHAVANAMMTVSAGRHVGKILMVRHMPWKRLRYCPACVVSDRARTKGQECYWHRIHQASGVFICPAHHTWLEESNVPSWGNAAAFVSAEKAGLTLVTREVSASVLNKQLEAISRESAHLLSIPGSTHAGETFARNLWPYLRSRSYITPSATRTQKVRVALLAYDLLQHYSADVFQLLGWQPHAVASKLLVQLSQILRHKQHVQEPQLMPLLALLLSCFLEVPLSELFQEGNGIASAQRATAGQNAGGKWWPCVNPSCEHYKKPSESIRLLETVWVKIHGSVSHYKRKSRLTCMCGYRWAVSQYVPSTGEPDRITVVDYGELWRADLRRLWVDPSYSIRRIAEHLHASRTSIRAHARKLGLAMPRNEEHRKWLPANADFLARRRVQRTALKELLQRHPSVTRQFLYKEYRNLYHWLMTWDCSWFDQCLPPRDPTTSPRRPKRTMRGALAAASAVSGVSEEARTPRIDIQAPGDVELAQRVRSTASQMVEEGSLLPIRWSTLRKRIPELSIPVEHLQKLPLTYAAVRDVAETGEEASVRRIFLLARQWRAQGQRITKSKLLKQSLASVYYRPPHKSNMVGRALQSVLGDQFD